jgi:hypothetical protein
VKTKVKLGAEEVEIEEFVSDEQEEGAIAHNMSGLLARRPSFMLMRNNMKAQVGGRDISQGPWAITCSPWGTDGERILTTGSYLLTNLVVLTTPPCKTMSNIHASVRLGVLSSGVVAHLLLLTSPADLATI